MKFRTVALLFAVGTFIGTGCASGSPQSRPHPKSPPSEWDVGAYKAAHAYADWCGGIVTDPFGVEGGPYVVQCDK